MEVTEAIEHAEAELENTLDELRMHRELVIALEADAKRMQLELVGLRSFASRQGLTSVPHDLGGDVVPISGEIELSVSAGPDLGVMSRSDAVAAVMRDAPGPLDRTAIHEFFVDGGRFDSIDDISLTLSGLKRSGRAEKLGQGLWQLVEEPSIRSAP